MDEVTTTPGALIYDAAAGVWLQFNKPVEVISTTDTGAVLAALARVEDLAAAGHYLVGFLAYEAAPAFDPAYRVRTAPGFPLLWFAAFESAVETVFPPQPVTDTPSPTWQLSIDTAAYHHALEKIKHYIRQGDTYQVNYTFRMRTRLDTETSQLFNSMIHAQGYGYGAYIDTGEWCICSASHELFFSLADGVLESRPMKGTLPRGLHVSDDTAQGAWLQQSVKNRAENLMIVDMVRNDMGRIADTGSVETVSLFDIERYPTLWQMTSTVRARTRKPLHEVLGALFPAASITGAPKKRTMEIIHELETEPRRIYTGTVGLVRPDSSAQFNVAIRTVLVDRRTNDAEYGVGGGIVWDSDTGNELQECHTKARILTHPRPPFQLLETLAWRPGEGLFLLPLHLRRLAASADYFGWQVDIPAVQARLQQAVSGLPPQPHRVRLLLHESGHTDIQAVPMQSASGAEYRVHLATEPVAAGTDPFLYHKTSRREVYTSHLDRHPGFDDVLLYNDRGEVTETCIANVIVEIDGVLYTPPVTSGLLAGTYRQYLLEQGQVNERVIRVAELEGRGRIRLVNSVRGMWDASLFF